MQLELTDNTGVTFYTPNPMSVLVQNFDTLERKMIICILAELKQHQKKAPINEMRDGIKDEISVVVKNITSRLSRPNGRDFINSVHRLSSRMYVSIDAVKYKYYEGKPLFSEVIYDARQGKAGNLSVTLNTKLNDAWLNLSNGYTPQYLEKCMRLKGKYAPALYDFICKYDKPKVISWRDLRVFLDINGEEYTNWQAFKKGVLIRSKELIEQDTVRTFHYKVVSGERVENMDLKKIKIWGEFNEKKIPEHHLAIVHKIIGQLQFDQHKQANYIKEYMFEYYEQVIMVYNEVINYPQFINITITDSDKWKEVGLVILKRLNLG
jgi:hypothetical protein